MKKSVTGGTELERSIVAHINPKVGHNTMTQRPKPSFMLDLLS